MTPTKTIYMDMEHNLLSELKESEFIPIDGQRNDITLTLRISDSLL